MEKNFSIQTKKNGGYIALMTTIIISILLLGMVGERAFAGSFLRFIVLGTEAKEQATALAEGCAEQALSTLITDPSYRGDSDIELKTASGEEALCHIFAIEFDTPGEGKVTIKTQAVVRDSYANVETVHELGDIYLGVTPEASHVATLIVRTIVTGGSDSPNDFEMRVSGLHPSKTSFKGSSTGVTVVLGEGSYSVSQILRSGYAYSTSAQCSGTISRGEIKTCTITNAPAETSLTVIANVVNDNGGTLAPSAVDLFIDGERVTLGEKNIFSEGSHRVSLTVPSGYAASSWGYQCESNGDVNLDEGEEKTCVVTLNDIAPALSCADTVMILDRTGSISSSDRANERDAANALIDIYAAATPPPKIAVGSFGGPGGSAAGIPSSGVLTNSYGTLRAAVSTLMSSASSVGSNLSAAIEVSRAELESVRHAPGKEKVLIFISDGLPNRPTNEAIAANAARDSAENAKDSGIRIFTIHYGDSSGQDFLRELSSGDDHFFIAPSSSDFEEIFETIGHMVCVPEIPEEVEPPTQATLFVVTEVLNDNGSVKNAADFTARVSGGSATPGTFAGVGGSGKEVTLNPGSYSVSQQGTPAGYAESMSASCSSGSAGSIAAGETRICTITNDDIGAPPPPPNPTISPRSWREVPTIE